MARLALSTCALMHTNAMLVQLILLVSTVQIQHINAARPTPTGGKELFANVPEADMEEAVPPSSKHTSWGGDLAHHIVKLNEPSTKGNEYGAIVGYNSEYNSYQVAVPHGGKILDLRKSDFTPLQQPANDVIDKLGHTVHVAMHDGAHSADILASGLVDHRVVIMAKEDSGRFVLLHHGEFLTQEQQREMNGVNKANELQDKDEQMAAQRNRDRAGNAKDGDNVRPQAHVPTDRDPGFSPKLAKALSRDFGDVDQLDSAVNDAEKRAYVMQQISNNAQDTVKKYGDSLAGKVKMFGQLEYKGRGLPTEATEKAEHDEEVRLSPFEAMQKAARDHTSFVAGYEKHQKDMLFNPDRHRDEWNDLFEKHFVSKEAGGEHTKDEGDVQAKKEASDDDAPGDQPAAKLMDEMKEPSKVQVEDDVVDTSQTKTKKKSKLMNALKSLGKRVKDKVKKAKDKVKAKVTDWKEKRRDKKVEAESKAMRKKQKKQKDSAGALQL